LSAGQTKPPFREKGDTMTPFTEERVTSATRKGDICDRNGDIAMSPEPINHQRTVAADRSSRQPTVVGKLMELGASRGQAINGTKVNPDLTLADVDHYRQWMQTIPERYRVGRLVQCLQEGILPAMPETADRVTIDEMTSQQIQALVNGAYDR
jgi:hypothetical protein